MNCIVIRSQERNGRIVGASYERMELTHAMAIETSMESSVVVSLETTPSGLNNVYQDGSIRQIDLRDSVYVGRHAEFDKHLGWVS